MYVCILKSKRAEWVALSELDDEHRDAVQVILELMRVKPVAGVSLSNSAFKALTTEGTWTAGKFLSKDLDVAVDARFLTKKQQVLIAARVASKLRKAGYDASPSVSVPAVLQEAASLGELSDAKVVTVRVPMLSVSTAQATQAITAVRKAVGGKAKLRVVLDAEDYPGNIDDETVINSAASLNLAIRTNCQVNQVAFAGGSFPQNLVAFRQGLHTITRREWNIWNELRGKPNCKDVLFGDYTVTHPKLPKLPANARLAQPSPAIRYALVKEWTLYKGVRSRDDTSNAQYKALCKILIDDPDYYGENFSFGDKMYAHHAQPGTSNGSGTTWRRDATSHHLVATLDEL